MRTKFISFLVGSTMALSLASAQVAKADITYSYDTLGRLASANFGNGVIVYYRYDENGNRLTQVVNTNASSGVWGSFLWGSGIW